MSQYILDAIKQAIIHNIDPSQLSDNPVDGLQQKEIMLSKFNPCFLREHVSDYDELEELVNNTIGSHITDILLDRLDSDDITMILPTRTITISSTVVHNVQTDVSVFLNNGNISYDLFNLWTWSILKSPNNSTVSITELSDIASETQRVKTYHMTFSHAGDYLLIMSIDHLNIDGLILRDTVNVVVT